MLRKILKIINNKYLKYLGILSLLVAYVVLFKHVSNKMDVDRIKGIVASFGIISPIIFILLHILTIIISPLAVSPVWMAGVSLFDIKSCLIFAHVAHFIGHTVNFYIARIWGRPIVTKFAGKKSMKEIDTFAEVVGIKLLLVFRLIGGPAADYISYGSGLTSIKFIPYFIATFIGGIPWTTITFWLTYKATISEGVTSTAGYFILLAILTLVGSSLVSLIILRTNSNYNKNKVYQEA